MATRIRPIGTARPRVEASDWRNRHSGPLRVPSADPYPNLVIRADDHPDPPVDPLTEPRRLHALAPARFVPLRPLPSRREHPGGFGHLAFGAAIETARAATPRG